MCNMAIPVTRVLLQWREIKFDNHKQTYSELATLSTSLWLRQSQWTWQEYLKQMQDFIEDSLSEGWNCSLYLLNLSSKMKWCNSPAIVKQDKRKDEIAVNTLFHLFLCANLQSSLPSFPTVTCRRGNNQTINFYELLQNKTACYWAPCGVIETEWLVWEDEVVFYDSVPSDCMG